MQLSETAELVDESAKRLAHYEYPDMVKTLSSAGP